MQPGEPLFFLVRVEVVGGWDWGAGVVVWVVVGGGAPVLADAGGAAVLVGTSRAVVVAADDVVEVAARVLVAPVLTGATPARAACSRERRRCRASGRGRGAVDVLAGGEVASVPAGALRVLARVEEEPQPPPSSASSMAQTIGPSAGERGLSSRQCIWLS